MTCQRCRNRMTYDLAELLERYAALPDLLMPGSGVPGPRTKPTSRPPLRIDVCAHLDARGTDSTILLLHSWARMVREERDLSAPERVTVSGEVDLLTTHNDWVCDQPWIDDYAKEIRHELNLLRGLAGERGPARIGQCPAVDEDGNRCGATLRAPLYGDVVKCRPCGATWPRESWMHLGRVLEAG
jgi:hypothetical protein